MHINRSKNIVIIFLVALLLWLVYLSDNEMARYGIYTIFSYNVHEFLGLIPFLSIIATIIWMLLTISKSMKEKGEKSNRFLSLILLALCVMQIVFVKDQNQIWNITCVTSVKSIQENKMEITINQNGRDIALECPMLVLKMIKADGTDYLITYEWKKSDPEHGKLCMIQSD